MKRPVRAADGTYTIHGVVYKELFGSREQANVKAVFAFILDIGSPSISGKVFFSSVKYKYIVISREHSEGAK